MRREYQINRSVPIDNRVNQLPNRPQPRSVPIRVGQIITTDEIVEDNQRGIAFATQSAVKDKVRQLQLTQHKREDAYFSQSKICPIGVQRELRDNLSKVNPQELKSLGETNFFDPAVMKSTMCITESMAYTPPPGVVGAGGTESNYRLRRWIKDLSQIGNESVEGYALSGDFDRAKNFFIVKAPRGEREPGEPTLLHEYFIGVYGLNALRFHVPNFAYVLGAFRCSQPYINQDTKKVEAWCNNTKYPIDYVIYENVAPALTIRDWIARSCNFADWLTYYLQVLYATQFAADKVDYTHFDLHDENVLRRQIPGQTETFAIPYQTEEGKTEYLITDAVATVIDYGMSHIKYKGEDYGTYDRTPWGIRPYGSFPLHDAYKFLLMSMRTMAQHGKVECFNKAALILKFFNDRESAEEIVKRQSITYYYLPYDDVTSKLSIYDLTKYIRQIFDTSNILVSSRPKGRILGCQGTDICLRSSQVLDKTGLTGSPMATTIFDFYDIINNLEAEGRKEEQRQVKRGFNYRLIVNSALKNYNDLLIVFNQKAEELNVYQINGSPALDILSRRTFEIYRRFISQVIKIYDTYQELGVMHDSIRFAAEIYNDKKVIREINDSYTSLRRAYDPVWIEILRSIAIDHKYIQSLRGDNLLEPIINLNIKYNPELRWWWTFFDEIVTIIS